LLDIFLFSLIIPPCPNYQQRSRYDVGNNSTKKQPEAEAGSGFQKAHEHANWKERHKPPQGKGKKASLSFRINAAEGCGSMPYAYRKSERLRKNTEFVSTMKGKRLSLDGLSLFYAGNGRGNFRVGISVSKKLANAVRRNRLKRQIRNSVMNVLAGYTLGYDLVFVARRELYSSSYEQIRKTVETILRRTALRNQDPEGIRT
jgi:ribonuclease P protein component